MVHVMAISFKLLSNVPYHFQSFFTHVILINTVDHICLYQTHDRMDSEQH